MTANVIILRQSGGVRGGLRKLRLSREGLLWLIVTVVMFVTGLFKGINLLILLAYLLVSLWFVNWQFVRHFTRTLRGRRLPHGPVEAGSPVELLLEISSVGKWPPRGVVIEDRGAAHARGWLILRLREGEPVCLRYQHVFEKRGRYQVAALTAHSQFPFGLVVNSAELAPAEEWVVFPRFGFLHAQRLKQWLAKSTRGDGRTRRRRLQPALHDADVHGLRDFRPGDNPRWIHWRSSARRNQVLVREFEDCASSELVLIVEPWLPDQAAPQSQARLEAVISMAATLCRNWCRELQARLTLIVSRPNAVFLSAGSGSEYALRAIELLAVQEGGPAERADRWIDRIQHVKATTAVLVLTSRPSSPLIQEIAFVLGRPVACVDAEEVVPWYEPPSRPAS